MNTLEEMLLIRRIVNLAILNQDNSKSRVEIDAIVSGLEDYSFNDVYNSLIICTSTRDEITLDVIKANIEQPLNLKNVVMAPSSMSRH